LTLQIGQHQSTRLKTRNPLANGSSSHPKEITKGLHISTIRLMQMLENFAITSVNRSHLKPRRNPKTPRIQTVRPIQPVRPAHPSSQRERTLTCMGILSAKDFLAIINAKNGTK